MNKTALLLILILSVFFSCRNETLNKSEQMRFDYSVFNARKSLYSTLTKIDNIIKQKKATARLEESSISMYQESIDNLNNEYGISLTILPVDIYQIENPDATIDDFQSQGFITSTDEEIINNFYTYLDTNDLDQSLNLLRSDIQNRNLTYDEFQKYNDFVNAIMIVNDYYLANGIDIFAVEADFLASSTTARRRGLSMGCTIAILSNSVATAGLSSCFVPGPNCAIAVIGKGLALAGLYYGCKDG